ncbi:MAG: hypothetical protein ACO1NO_09025 [Burkholderiaceae bacterium]
MRTVLHSIRMPALCKTNQRKRVASYATRRRQFVHCAHGFRPAIMQSGAISTMRRFLCESGGIKFAAEFTGLLLKIFSFVIPFQR